jgi:putative nucleotidyltransferase with HDIG domain
MKGRELWLLPFPFPSGFYLVSETTRGEPVTVACKTDRGRYDLDDLELKEQMSSGESAPNYSAIILAAGYSSRMGQFKPLLRVGDCFAVTCAVRLFLDAGVSDVSVVAGHRADELYPIVEALGARCIRNSEFDQGMYSSVRAGVAALPTGVKACFVMPVDIPLVRASTVRRMAGFFAGCNKSIVYPVFEGRRGHPPLISHAVLRESQVSTPDAKLSSLLAAHEAEACDLFVPDEGIHRDMDTPDDLAKIRDLASQRVTPSPRECEALLSMYQTKFLVVQHSRAVADVAYRIALALAERGVAVDPYLVRAGGLLHDVAKGMPSHAEAGAQLLRQFEFENVARVVAAHTECSFDEQNLDEAAIVYLADKLVSGERLVGIAQRFDRSLARFRENPTALAAALRRRATAEAIAREVEKRLGVEFQSLVGGTR